jgi:hypothetical protein
MSTPSTSAALLRQLEPAVRPVRGAAAPQPGAAPFERLDFQTLVRQAMTQPTDAPSADAAPDAQPVRPAALGGIDRVANASLRLLLE